MVDWKKMKTDISKGLKDGAGTVAKKTEEITEEGQRKLKVHNLKKKMQDLMEDLGGEIYNAEKKTPGSINHDGSMVIFRKIEVLSKELKDLEKS